MRIFDIITYRLRLLGRNICNHLWTHNEFDMVSESMSSLLTRPEYRRKNCSACDRLSSLLEIERKILVLQCEEEFDQTVLHYIFVGRANHELVMYGSILEKGMGWIIRTRKYGTTPPILGSLLLVYFYGKVVYLFKVWIACGLDVIQHNDRFFFFPPQHFRLTSGPFFFLQNGN